MADYVIEARNLIKTFDGVVAVSGMDLKVPAGGVLGLVGRNGAGKTTLIRLLMALLRPSAGQALVLGKDLWLAGPSHRARVAYVSQEQQLHNWMTLEELCSYAAWFYPNWDVDYAHTLADRFGLPWKMQVGLLSGGQKRKAAVLIAFAARVEVLLLDEPAAGLDPIARRELIDLIIDTLVSGNGITVLLSTHIITDLERIAETVAFMDRGKIVSQATLSDLQSRMRRVQVIFPTPQVPESFAVPGAIRTQTDGAVVSAVVRVFSETQLDVVRQMEGVRVSEFPINLEDIFIELLGPAATSPMERSI